MTVIFPDVEPVLVSHLTSALDASTKPVASGVRVGTVKLPADSAQASKQVVLTVAYNQTRLHVVKEATVTVEVFANKYADASALALLVSALVVDVPRTVIKRAEVTFGPVRVADDGPQERRAFTLELTVKGSNL